MLFHKEPSWRLFIRNLAESGRWVEEEISEAEKIFELIFLSAVVPKFPYSWTSTDQMVVPRVP